MPSTHQAESVTMVVPPSRVPELGNPRRGKYAKLSDIQFLATVIRDQELGLQSPSSRPTFWVNGKSYRYSEIARRIRRAKISGKWTQGPESTVLPPSHIQIFAPSMQEAERVSLPASYTHGTHHYGQPLRSSFCENHVVYEKCIHDVSCCCFEQLVHMNNDARISVPPSYPDELLVPTSFCYYIVRYLRGAHDNGLFVSNDTGELVSRSSAESFRNLNNFHKCCITAIDLLGRKCIAQGFALVSIALVLVEQTLEEQDPKLLDVLCDVSILLHTKGMGQLYEILKEKVCSMVEIIALKKGEQHQPWAQIFTLIRKLPGAQVVETMRRGWECGYDQLESLLPEHPWHALNISCSSDYPLRMGNTVQKHWDTLLTRSVRPQDGDIRDMQRHFACSKILYLQGNYREALESLNDVLSQCSQARQQGEMKWVTMEIDALEVSARCHYATGTLSPSGAEISSAERKLRIAIGLSGRIFGTKSATTIALQHTLWLWLLEQGRNEDAAVWEKAVGAVVDASGRADV